MALTSGTRLGPPDGQRFLMITASGGAENAEAASIILVQNWFEELRQRVPVP